MSSIYDFAFDIDRELNQISIEPAIINLGSKKLLIDASTASVSDYYLTEENIDEK